MQSNTNNGGAFLATVAAAGIMTVVCGLIIFSLTGAGAGTATYKPAILGFLGVGIFFIPLIFIFYFFYRDKPLAVQCGLSAGIAIVELGSFLSSQRMPAFDGLFILNLFIVALGAACFPLVYRLFVKG